MWVPLHRFEDLRIYLKIFLVVFRLTVILAACKHLDI